MVCRITFFFINGEEVKASFSSMNGHIYIQGFVGKYNPK
jgi:hypothetical protein